MPGEVEYSDDEDYIRNESVISGRHTKIVDESVFEEQQVLQPSFAREHNESVKSQREAGGVEGEQLPLQSEDPPSASCSLPPGTQT